MNKTEFLEKLRTALSGLPSREIEERLSFYSEMIDDRAEDGCSEEDAVAQIGSVEKVAEQIMTEIPLVKIVKEKIKPKRKKRAWEIVLLAVGSPIWLSLGIAAFAVVISIYAVLWSLIVSLWAVFGALSGTGLGGVFAGVMFMLLGYVPTGTVTVGAAIVCAGSAILLFFGCLAATKGTAVLTKKIAVGIKRCFVGKEKR